MRTQIVFVLELGTEDLLVHIDIETLGFLVWEDYFSGLLLYNEESIVKVVKKELIIHALNLTFDIDFTNPRDK